MAEHKYTQMQSKNKREVVREVDGKNKTYIRFKGVLRYSVANDAYKDKPEGVDTRKANEKRRTVWKEISKTLEVEKGRSKKQTDTNVADALKIWREEVEEREQDTSADTLLLDYIEQYITAREAAQIIEKSTATDYRHTKKRLEKKFRDTTLKGLTADAVQRYETAELKRGVSATTVGKVHRLLKQVLAYATKHEIIERNVMVLVDPPKRPKKQPNGLDVAEAQRLTGILLNMQPTPICTAAFLALHASLRAGEACALQWADVDEEGKTIRINKAVGLAQGGAYLKATKNNSSTRTVNITEDLARKLTERREFMRAELRSKSIMLPNDEFEKLYVCGTIDGKYLNPQILTRKWTAIAEAFNVMGTEGKRASFHTLRHGFATVGIATGVDVASVAAQMGHSNVAQTLNTYTSSTADGKRRAAQTIGAAMHPSEKEAELHQLKTGTED